MKIKLGIFYVFHRAQYSMLINNKT